MKELLKKISNRGGEHLLFLSSTMITAGFQFIYSIYVKAYVLPYEYGIYSTCLLLQTYLTYLQLGSLNAFNRDYSQLVGAGKSDEASEYRNTVFSFLIISFSIATLIITIIVLILMRTIDIDIRKSIGFILISVITELTIIENYGNYRCKIDRGFSYPSIVSIVEMIALPIGLVLISQKGYYGIYIVTITMMVIGIVMYFNTSYKDARISINYRLLKDILVSGSPLLISSLIWTVVNSIDKFLILGFIDTEALGMYAIAQNAFSYMILIPSALSQMFYVKMGKEYGASGDKGKLNTIAVKFTMILAAITSCMSIFAYYFVPDLVKWAMPNYIEGVKAAQILIVGLAMYATTMINSNILTILKKNRALLNNSIYMCVFNAICSIGFIFITGRRIESIALGTATSYIFCSFIIIYQVHKYAEYNALELIKVSVVPIILTIVPAICIYHFASNVVFGFLFSMLVVIALGFTLYHKYIQEIMS